MRAVAKMAAGIAISGAGVLMFATPAFAGVGVGVAPDFPSPVQVGDNNVPVTLGITNNSSGGDGNPLTLNSIKLIPSCGAISGTSCATPDTGVFHVDAAATGAGSCSANTFTVAETNVTTGEVTFTPNASITLTPGQTCTVNFTVDVVGVPDTDATAAPGIQTLQLANVAGTDQNLQPGSGFGSDATTVNKGAPSIATVQSAGGPIGTVLNDTATLTGGATPTGNVTFKLYPPSDATCSLAPAYNDVDASAPYATSPGFASNTAGVWHWTADYAGDANNLATSSGCTAEPITISKAAPTIATLLSNLGPVSVGATVHDSATLSGATATAGGSVAYVVYTDAACSVALQGAGVVTVTNGIVPDSNGVTFNTPGTYNWQAVYSGDANNTAATSTCQSETLVVNKLSSSVTTDIHDANHSVITSAAIGATVHDKATVAGSGPVPTGTVSFSLYSGSSCTGATTTETVVLAAGTAETSGTAVGATGLSYKAFYNGDASYTSSVGACEPLTATKFTPTISTLLSSTATTTGAFVHDSATLSGATATAGGTATYSVYTNNTCSLGKVDAGTKVVTNGLVPDSNTLQFNTAGTFYWQVVYSGDAANNAATSTCGSEIVVITQPVGQYCSPGYWKQSQHFDSYVTYHPTDLFDTVFGVSTFPGKTLVQVLSTGGGGLTAYGRATVGALLNSTSMSSGLTAAQVIAKFDATFNGAPKTGNTNGYYGSANPEFTAPENCPLN